MLLQKVDIWAGGCVEGWVLGPPHDGLQQRSEWPRILHSAVHAHSPNIKERGREHEYYRDWYASIFRMSDRLRVAAKENL